MNIVTEMEKSRNRNQQFSQKRNTKNGPKLKDDERINDCMFLAVTMQHLQSLNLALKVKDKIITDLSQTVPSSIGKNSAF